MTDRLAADLDSDLVKDFKIICVGKKIKLKDGLEKAVKDFVKKESKNAKKNRK